MRREYQKKQEELKPGESMIYEEILAVRRVSTKRVGGSSFHFSVLSVAGDKNGNVGVAIAKSLENTNAIQKSKNKARRSMIKVYVTEDKSIPHEIRVKSGSAVLLLKPAPLGSGIIAGGVIRTILDYAGISNISAKMIGSHNPINNSYALIEALKQLHPVKKVKKEAKDE